MLRLISILLIIVGLGALGLGVISLMSPAPALNAEASDATTTTGTAAPPGSVGFDEPIVSIENMSNAAGTEILRRVPIAHETPDSAAFGRAFDVTLSIDATGAASAIAALPGRETVVEGEADVSGDVRVALTGSGFDIEDRSPADQVVSPITANTWRWEVTPVRTGPQDLVLEIYALVGDRALPVRTFRDTVTVEVSNFRRAIFFAQAANPLIMVLGGIGSVLGGAFTALRFFKG
ncbi:MAG: hypothetical protein AAF216_03250 [Pseudomonadota bacterium]